LSAFCQPARAVGGDYYDFIKLTDGHTAIAVADVAGKGISAALLMSSVQASLRSQAMVACANAGETTLPADLVRTMNRLVHASTGAASYVTFFYAQFDEEARTLSYVNAGHNPPLLVRTRQASDLRSSGQTRKDVSPQLHSSFGVKRSASACPNGTCVAVLEEEEAEVSYSSRDDLSVSRTEVKELTEGGPVLGFFEDCHYEQETLSMESGDLLIAYTDGLTESLNAEGLEFGEEQLREALDSCSHGSAQEVRDAVVRRVREWSSGVAQHDDLTFVVLRVK
jgi:serine phosphatase RsbU (regulator of sigma subunit)